MTVSAVRPVRIPITRPCVGEEEGAAAAEAVRSGWLSQGKQVQEFEQELAAYIGVKHAILVSNCTTALHLALVAAGIGPGDEVLCPSFTFIATANAVLHAGATPVFVDIDPQTYNTTAELLETAITPKTRALIPVDQIGLAADMPAIMELAHRRGLAVIEDAAPSLGATVNGQKVGKFADFTCFSFHPRKSITTGEGGLIATDDDHAAERLRAIRSHGVSTSAFARHASGTTDIEVYHEVGWNYRMTDIQAAVGRVQLRKLDGILDERRRLASRYDQLFAQYAQIQTPHVPPGRPHTYQSYCIWLHGGVDRAQVMATLAQRGIASRRGVMASHLEPFYREMYPTLSLPVTEAAAAETLLLPLYVGMTPAEQDEVVAAVVDAL
jgi:perosamine synthetase